MYVYRAWNSAMATTTAQGKVTTGTAIKTMLQLATPATVPIKVHSWGYSIDAAPTVISVVELIQTDVAATVTAHAAAGVQPTDGNSPASRLTLGTSATGFTSSSEGSTTASRCFDVREIAASNTGEPLTHRCVFTPAERPVIPVSKFLRVRATFGSAVNMACWICWEE
jgi:hypothetical protein